MKMYIASVCLVTALICTVDCYYSMNEVTYSEYPQYQSEAVYGHDVPVLKMLKRQIRNFVYGKTACITLVFTSSQRVMVRWFRLDPKRQSRGSELPNMLPVEGSPGYHIKFIASGDVTATTLYISKFNMNSDNFPRDFETILTTKDATMQYKIKTVIRAKRTYLLENIDSPEWMTIPSPRISFYHKHRLNVPCKIFVPKEMAGYTNELTMYRAMPVPGSDNVVKMEYQNVIMIHQDGRTYAEENGPLILQGIRLPQKHHHVIYEVHLTTGNATPELEGIYQCELEREYDKIYVLSSVTSLGRRSPFPKTPRVTMVACNKKQYNGGVLNMFKGEETCLRCRGFGYPRPRVALFKKGEELRADSQMTVNKYINVADAGVVEATYIFHDPSSRSLFGNYSCQAINENGVAREKFQLHVLPFRDNRIYKRRKRL